MFAISLSSCQFAITFHNITGTDISLVYYCTLLSGRKLSICRMNHHGKVDAQSWLVGWFYMVSTNQSALCIDSTRVGRGTIRKCPSGRCQTEWFAFTYWIQSVSMQTARYKTRYLSAGIYCITYTAVWSLWRPDIAICQHAVWSMY